MTNDEKYMRRCIQLAQSGQQNAQPNPMVGAVIVSADGRIIGEGYHVRCGEGHAEVNAFASVSPDDEALLKDATIYVSLEPCSHYGKTPPCADLIVSKGVRRAVVGCVDPFAKVQGRGIQRLRDAGIEVTVGVCETECRELNKVFFTYHSLHRPFITLKWAMTADGVIGIKTDAADRLLISNPLTNVLCHKRRAEHQAILVGHNTWNQDHPSLNVRHWTGHTPRRIVLGNNVDADETVMTYDGDLKGLLDKLYAAGIQSLLVEGGRQTLQSFIDAGLWDEAYVEISADKASAGRNDKTDGITAECVKAPVITDYQSVTSTSFGGHVVKTYKHSSINEKDTDNQSNQNE